MTLLSFAFRSAGATEQVFFKNSAVVQEWFVQLLRNNRAYVLHVCLPTIDGQPVMNADIIMTVPASTCPHEVLLRKHDVTNSDPALQQAVTQVERQLCIGLDIAEPTLQGV